MNRIKGELKRPLAFLLVICMLVIMMPYAPWGIESHATVSGDIGGTRNVTSDEDWEVSSIAAGATVNIAEGCTVTLFSKVQVYENVTINGPGTIQIADNGAFFNIVKSNVTFSDVTILGYESAGVPVIVVDADKAGFEAYATLHNTKIIGANCTVANMPAAVFFNNPSDLNHRIYLTGTTEISGNQAPKGAISDAGSAGKVYVQDSVKVCNNTNTAISGNGNINLSGTACVHISDPLTSDANIGVSVSGGAGTKIAEFTGASTDQLVAAKEAFFIDDFHNFGVVTSGTTDLQTASKATMTVSKIGSGTLEVFDTHSRSIVDGSGNIKEVPGNEVVLQMNPIEGYFVRTADISDSVPNYVVTAAAMTTYSAVDREKQLVFDMPSGGGTADIVFEEAVNAITIGNVDYPLAFETIGSSLSGADISAKNPGTANVTIASIEWYDGDGDGSTPMGAAEKFTYNHNYIMKAVFNTYDGSKFAEAGNITVTGPSGSSITGETQITVSNNETTLTVINTYTSAKQQLSDAIAKGYVTISVDPDSAVYDRTYHGPKVTVVDANNGKAEVYGRDSGVGSYTGVVTAGTSSVGVFTTTSDSVDAKTIPGSYSADIKVTIPTNYDGEYITTSAFNIEKRHISASGINSSGVISKPYDGKTDVPGTLGVTFSNVAGIDNLSSAYTATYSFSDANVADVKTVNATGITLNLEAQKLYILDNSSVSVSGGSITKATPKLTDGAISFTPVTVAGTTLGGIDFKLTPGKWFENEHNLTLHVDGTLTLVADPTTVIPKNGMFSWLFTPADLTNYTTATGIVNLWPTEPIKNVTISGVTVPSAGAVNNLTAADLGFTCGPTASSQVTVTGISWTEYNPNNGLSVPFAYGSTFKYNRTYTVTLNLEASDGDVFVTTANALKVDIKSGPIVKHMTQVSVDSIHATYSCEFVIGRGELNPNAISVFGATQVCEYDGTEHPIKITKLPEYDDEYLHYCVSTDGGIHWSADKTLAGFTDYIDGAGHAAKIRFSHDDYTGNYVVDQYITITQRPITSLNIDSVTSRPYNGTTAVEVAISSSNILASDLSKVTFAAVGTISNPNVTTASVSVTASDVVIGGERSNNYILSPASITKTVSKTNIIKKVTPTHSGISWTAISTSNPKFADLGLHMQDIINEYAPGLGTIPGSIRVYSAVPNLADLGANLVYAGAGSVDVEKFKNYHWLFIPANLDNYERLMGTATFWPGAPIKNVTITGITAPAALAESATLGALELVLPETANVNIESVNWHENDTEFTTGSDITAGDAFKYNRSYTVTLVLKAASQDTFSPSLAAISAAAIMDLGVGDVRGFDVVLSDKLPDSENYKTATLTYTFETRTAKGVLADENLNRDGFKSIDSLGGVHPLNGEDYSGKWVYSYIYSGRKVSPAAKAVSLQAIDITNLKYSVKGGAYTETVPEYVNYTEGDIKIDIQMTHPDYTGTITKTVYLRIAKCKVRPEGVIYSGKIYDGTNKITGAKIIWMPNDAGFELGTAAAISEDLIHYTAKYEFDNENVMPNKQIKVSNISAVGNNFDIEVLDVPDLVTKIDATSCWMTSCGALISKSSATPKNGSILNKSVSSAVSLSAITTDYITTDCSVSNGSVMVNPQNTSLKVYGHLYLTTGAGVAMTDEEMDETAIVQGATYTWAFVPGDAANYLPIVTGSQILWPFPPPSGGGGGGGGGGVISTPSGIGEGVVVTKGAVGVDQQIHIYLGRGGQIVVNEYFYASVTGGAVAAAVAKVPNGNVLVDQNGQVVIKGIIENGKLQTYLIGDHYLTVEHRQTDYVDMGKHWSKAYVDFCSNRGLVNGTGEGKFSPDDTLTRGMAATIFYRLESSPSLTSSARWFADVERGQWYTEGIAWAGGAGVVNGIGVKNFAPHWAITREQMAVMIYNYCRLVQGSTPVQSGSLDMSLYYDSSDISDWARDAVAYCYKAGLMMGDEDGNFCPQLSATRAEFATIMERLIRGILNKTI